MLKFLIVIFLFFVLLVFLMGFSIIRTVKNILFGGGNEARCGERRQSERAASDNYRSTNNTVEDEDRKYVHRKKIFGKDEGEYVDYEEVK